MPIPGYCCIDNYQTLYTWLKVNEKIYFIYIGKYSLNTHKSLITNIIISNSRRYQEQYHDNTMIS